MGIVGTYFNNIKPSPTPVLHVAQEDPFYGGDKFAFISIELLPQETDLTEKILRMITGKDTVCIMVARVIEDRNAVDIGDYAKCECKPDLIIDKVAQLSYKYGSFEEVYVDRKVGDYLNANQFWSKYCLERNDEIVFQADAKRGFELVKMKAEAEAIIIDKHYDLSLLKVDRQSDLFLRQMNIEGAFKREEIGLVPTLLKDSILTEAIRHPNGGIISDAVSGVLTASLRYR